MDRGFPVNVLGTYGWGLGVTLGGLLEVCLLLAAVLTGST